MLKLLALAVATIAAPALAGTSFNSAIYVATPVPVLEDVGLIVLSLVIAVAGGLAVRRRNRSKSKQR